MVACAAPYPGEKIIAGNVHTIIGSREANSADSNLVGTLHSIYIALLDRCRVILKIRP
jgi:hypothetical protein